MDENADRLNNLHSCGLLRCTSQEAATNIGAAFNSSAEDDEDDEDGEDDEVFECCECTSHNGSNLTFPFCKDCDTYFGSYSNYCTYMMKLDFDEE